MATCGWEVDEEVEVASLRVEVIGDSWPGRRSRATQRNAGRRGQSPPDQKQRGILS